MANLFSGIIKSNGEYKDLSVESGIAFEVGKDYQIQFFNKGYIREGEEGTGFCIYEAVPFTLRFKGDPVYVQSATKIEVNIAE
jgi:hypothetical protein